VVIWEINKKPSPRTRKSSILGAQTAPPRPKPTGKGGGLRPPTFWGGEGLFGRHKSTISGSFLLLLSFSKFISQSRGVGWLQRCRFYVPSSKSLTAFQSGLPPPSYDRPVPDLFKIATLCLYPCMVITAYMHAFARAWEEDAVCCAVLCSSGALGAL
jgi:hypothetical protein